MLPECEESIENTNSNGSRIPEEENIKFYFKKNHKKVLYICIWENSAKDSSI